MYSIIITERVLSTLTVGFNKILLLSRMNLLGAQIIFNLKLWKPNYIHIPVYYCLVCKVYHRTRFVITSDSSQILNQWRPHNNGIWKKCSGSFEKLDNLIRQPRISITQHWLWGFNEHGNTLCTGLKLWELLKQYNYNPITQASLFFSLPLPH